jgi:hypothetical protein
MWRASKTSNYTGLLRFGFPSRDILDRSGDCSLAELFVSYTIPPWPTTRAELNPAGLQNVLLEWLNTRFRAWSLARRPSILPELYRDHPKALQSNVYTGLGIRTGLLGFDFRKGRFFLFSTASRTTLGLIKPSTQWVPGQRGKGVKLTTHLHLVPRSIMVELYLHSLQVFMTY